MMIVLVMQHNTIDIVMMKIYDIFSPIFALSSFQRAMQSFKLGLISDIVFLHSILTRP